MDDQCGSCEAKDSVIVALQHVIRDLRHELENERSATAATWEGEPDE